MKKKIWYALQCGDYEEWDYGSESYDIARQMADEWHSRYPEDQITLLVIDNCDNPVVIETENIYQGG